MTSEMIPSLFCVNTPKCCQYQCLKMDKMIRIDIIRTSIIYILEHVLSCTYCVCMNKHCSES